MTQRALVLHKYGQIPILQEFSRPVPQPGQFLIKVEASTLNPSDRLKFTGHFYPVPLPAVMGGEATGRVLEANGQDLQSWIGKRVSFMQTGSGAWAQFAISTPDYSFVIDQDVPLSSAASGVVNPLTVIGMLQLYFKTPGKKGIIHTAASSALGRMLNKRCLTLGIPLLNIVRRQEQALLLKSEGAKHVIVTQQNWQQQYNAAIQEIGFNVLFDCLGGGPILESLIEGLAPGSFVNIYGSLEDKPLQLSNAVMQLVKGVTIGGYSMPSWYGHLSPAEKELIRKDYSGLLKGDLATHGIQTLNYSQIEEAIEMSVKKASRGKVLLVPS